jgi:hypothetical protein
VASVVPEDKLKVDSGAAARPLERPKIPGFRLEKIIGRGATGVVWRAMQVAVERPVALKILHPELVGTKRAIRRLQREARTGARLAHPSIISAIDMGEVDGLWWYAMELVVGMPLSRRLRERGPMSEREALRLFSPLCDALQHAYESGVVHRDIKPANILVDTHGRSRLVDLGLAFAEDDPMLTKTGGTLGTPHYISPEQARDPSTADTRSDIWSLGATMYQALCGVPPFEGESVAEILSGVLYQRVPDPRSHRPGLSKGISLVLRKCLAREPERRYQTPDGLMLDLERLRERRNPGVRAGSLDPVAGGRPLWLLPAIIAGVAIVAGVSWAVVNRPWMPNETGVSQDGTRAENVQLGYLSERFEAGEHSHADTWLALQDLPVDADQEGQRDDLRTHVLRALDRELQGAERVISQAFERHLASGHFLAAADAIDADWNRRLKADTGFQSLRSLPIVLRPRYQRVFGEMGMRLANAREKAVEAGAASLGALFDDEIRPSQAALMKELRWADARQELRKERTVWLKDAGVDVTVFSESELETIFAAIEGRLSRGRSELLQHWLSIDLELKVWVEDLYDELSDGLNVGKVRSAAQAIESGYVARLTHVGIDAAQVPDDWVSNSRRSLVDRRQLLREEEREFLIQYAASTYEDTEGTFEHLCRLRRYAEAADLWRTRRDDALLIDIRDECALRLRECHLLFQVLERCARGLTELSPTEEYAVNVKSIRTEGRIEVGADPLARGLSVVPRGGEPIALVMMGPTEADQFLMAPRDIERFADLEPHTLSDSDKLLRALFRFHEGDLEAALAWVPHNLLSDPLVSDLHNRITRMEERVKRGRRARDDQMVRALRQIRIDARNQEGAGAYGLYLRVERFLAVYGDLVSEEDHEELTGIAHDSRIRSKPTLASAYAPDRIRDLGDQTELSWRFDRASSGAWETGPWRWDGEGWSQPRALGTEEVLAAGGALRLELGSPLDVLEGCRIELDFGKRLSAERSTNTLFVHLAGYTLAILEDRHGQRLIVDGVSETELLDRLDQGKSQRFVGLPWDRDFIIGFEVDKGRVKLTLDGKAIPLGKSLVKRRGLDPEDLEFRLRSVQPLRLLGARLIASRN